ncbi:alpha/beta fold hydrolase [Glycomyces algeriensis]|uniref:Alpha/beta hydrolase n=1 Tax=Glycomyces algeriensis TaxID=256037 RepID=A0A9W6G6P4_9ACTN|nr:alpha/beta hydrolase [Glycomyces algeriensis]MDA1369089.1 alpha/beta hydrolase [Glycomyces algeriensis]MDR7348614.1 pimeloyl-ACP methyl ester carboxylesterase [Glycomyces algeriensis]GLI41319.1 alpha/beta hydrolase [Glycomyces algeriensis]
MNEIVLTTKVQGSGQGIVLAHGAGGGIEGNFASLIPALAENHTVVGSDYPADDTELTLDTLADALVADAVAAGVEAFTVIGFSLGTTVAVRAAVRHPERVRGLVLAAGFAKADNRLALGMRIWEDTARSDRESFARYVLDTGFGARFINGLPAEQVEQLTADLAANVPGGVVGQARLVRAADTTGDLANVAVPTLVVNATADLLVDPANSRVLAEGIPGAEYTEIDAGHVLMAEQSKLWEETVTGFLAKHGL